MQGKTKDDFKPELLVGKTIFFQCQDQSVKPVTFKVGKIIVHRRCFMRGWTYIGRADLVSYEVDVFDGKLVMDYQKITALLDFGIFTDKYGLVFKIIN